MVRFLSAVALSLSLLSAARAQEGTRVLPEGKVPNDRRFEPPKDLNGYFPFLVPQTKKAWEKRAAELRRRVRVATGVWPEPERTPLKPVIHGKVDRPGFTVEKVYFQSYPNHYVTGLLFRPKGKEGKRPAVLCPHGHGGRLQDYGEKRLRQMITRGEERFENSGRTPKLARCAQLARMGCVVFIYDMLGYADSVQISYQLTHRHRTLRPELDSPGRWGFYSTQAEMRLQSIMGIQTWNSVRALDFLAQLPDVDPRRMAVTGGSGGGTQTILLGAIDPRPIAAFPQGMVSTAMQGGCTCENTCLLRIGTGNVELAALFAPRPQSMTTANDWTKAMMTKGFPELKKLYTMLGVPKNVDCKPFLHFPHNYNYVTRAVMYHWMNRHLKLGLKEPIVEEDWERLTAGEYTVWNDAHPKPNTGVEVEVAFLKQLAKSSDRHIAALKPSDKASLEKYRRIVGGAVATLIGRGLPGPEAVEREKVDKKERGDYWQFKDLVRVKAAGEELPVISFYPKGKSWNGIVVIWIDGKGKAGMFADDGSPRPQIRKLLNAGASVIGADLLYQGDFLKDGRPLKETRKVRNQRQFAGYTFTYNHPLFARRVHDILTLVSFVANYEPRPEKVRLVGVNGAGPWAAAARSLAEGRIDRAVVDTDGFRFRTLKSYRDVNFLPGAVKYGDVPALLSLSAPHKLWISGEDGKVPGIVKAAYDASGWGGNVTSSERGISAAVDWLLDE